LEQIYATHVKLHGSCITLITINNVLTNSEGRWGPAPRMGRGWRHRNTLLPNMLSHQILSLFFFTQGIYLHFK